MPPESAVLDVRTEQEPPQPHCSTTLELSCRQLLPSDHYKGCRKGELQYCNDVEDPLVVVREKLGLLIIICSCDRECHTPLEGVSLIKYDSRRH